MAAFDSPASSMLSTSHSALVKRGPPGLNLERENHSAAYCRPSAASNLRTTRSREAGRDESRPPKERFMQVSP
jgi:hypothetical protein